METNELNKKYELQIEILTPLHVGAGAEKDWVQGADFIVDDNQVHVLNLNKVAQFVNIADLTKALLEKNGKFIKDKLGNNLDKCVDTTFVSNYSGTNDIKTFIKNGLTNKPIIPGSSLKGAIRSILTDYLLDENSKRNKRLDEKILFGKPNDGDEFMRFIKVSDAQFDKTEILKTRIFNLSGNLTSNWKTGNSNANPEFSTFYEVIEPNDKSNMSISIADKAFENFKKVNERAFSQNKTNLINDNKQNLTNFFSLINLHTRKYLKKERTFFKKYDQAQHSDKIIASIDSILDQIPENGEFCILKMAAGSGFHSITGDWQFEDYSIDRVYSEFTNRNTGQLKQKSRGNKNVNGKFEESAKSRKIAISSENEFTLMGFVKLTVLDEKMLAFIEKEKETKRQNELANILKLKQEQLLLEQQKAETEAKKKEFSSLISQAQALYSAQDYKSAISKIELAEALNIEIFSHHELKKLVLKAIEIQTKLEEIEALKQQEEEKRKAETEAKLAFGLAAYLEEKNLKNEFKVNNFGILKAKVEKYLKDSANDKLPENELIVLEQCIKRVYHSLNSRDQKEWQKFDNNKIWIEITGWANVDFAKSIFSKII